MTTTAQTHRPMERRRGLLGRLHVTGVFWYRFHLWGVRVLPRWLVGPAIALFVTFFFLLLGDTRRAVGNNLAAAVGPCGFWRRQVRVFRNLWTYAWCLTERYERLATDRRVETVEGEGGDHWRRLIGGEKGFLLVTAHIGHWEAGSAIASSGFDRRVHVIREAEIDPDAQTFFRDLLASGGEDRYVLHFVNDETILGAKLLFALRQGDVVALQGDRQRIGQRTLPATLFDRPFEVPAGPALVARAAGVPLLPVFVFRDGRLRSRVMFRQPIEPPHTGDRDADLRSISERLAAETEWAIRQHPYQWFCFRDLWPAA